MHSINAAKAAIRYELTSDDTEVRAEFIGHFVGDVDSFVSAMASALVNWRSLDDDVQDNERKAYVSAWVYTAITLHIQSMKLLLSGHPVAAGNLYRQVVETMALALICSGKELNFLDRVIAGKKYATHDALRDLRKHAQKLSINLASIDALEAIQKFNNAYSHPSVLTVSSGMAFGKKGLYIGAAFDPTKLEAYKRGITSRCNCAEVFSNFIDGVKANVARW